jgi:hypothetical protein
MLKRTYNKLSFDHYYEITHKSSVLYLGLDVFTTFEVIAKTAKIRLKNLIFLMRCYGGRMAHLKLQKNGRCSSTDSCSLSDSNGKITAFAAAFWRGILSGVETENFGSITLDEPTQLELAAINRLGWV